MVQIPQNIWDAKEHPVVIAQAASENRRTKNKLEICNMVPYGQTNRAGQDGLNINLLHTLILIYFLQ